MTAIKTEIGAQADARKHVFAPTSTIPKSDVWSAIQYVYDTIAAVIATVVAAQYTADAARSIAQSAQGAAAANSARIDAINDLQIAMKAQFYN